MGVLTPPFPSPPALAVGYFLIVSISMDMECFASWSIL